MITDQLNLKRCCCIAGLICLGSAVSFGQAPESVTNGLPATNTLAQTNAIAPTTPSVPTAAIVFTNVASATNDSQTNLTATTNSLGQTNPVSATNEVALTNDADQANAIARSNLALLIATNREHASFQAVPGQTRLDYPAFRMIAERNIFNPNRSRNRRDTSREERPRPRSTEGFSLVGTMAYEKGMFAFFDGTSSEYRKALKPGDEIAGFKLAEIGYNRVKLISKTNEIELPISQQMRHQEDGEWILTQETASYGSDRPAPSTSTSGFGERRFGDRSFSDRSFGDRSYRSRDDRRSQYSSGSGNASGYSSNSATNPAAATMSTESTPAAESTVPATEASSGSADDVLKRLMEKRKESEGK